MLAPIISARPEIESVKELLESAELPTSDLAAAHCEHFFYAGHATRHKGVVGIELFGEVGLLRSLVVRHESRGMGLGSALVSHVERYAWSQGVRAIYLLTSTAELFFSTLGYTRASRDEAPLAIKSTSEFSSICPASAAFMTKML